MEKFKKIVLYCMLWVLFMQNMLFGIVYADTDSACVWEATNNSCDLLGVWYSYNTKSTCCVCTNPLVSWSCESVWPGYLDNGKWCCIYACSVCTSASTEFQNYINFQVEMFQILQNVIKDPEKKVELKKEWLFSSNLLVLSSRILESWKNMFKKNTKDATDLGKAIKISAIMLSTITAEIVWKDSIWWLKILFRNKPFVREWKTLQDLDMTIYDLTWDFGMKWVWDDPVSDEVRQEIEKLKKKYVMNSANENWLFDNFDFIWTAKYKNIVGLLQKSNSLMKDFIANHSKVSDSWFFGNAVKKFEKEISKGNVILKFNKTFVENLYGSYRCAEWTNACNNKWEDFKKAINVLSTIKESFADSMKLIKKANDEMAKVFIGKNNPKSNNEKKNNNSSLTDKQVDLLRIVYGVDTSKITQQQWFGIATLLNGSAFKNIANGVRIQPLDMFSKESIDAQKENWQVKKRNRQDQLYLDSLATSNTSDVENQIKNQSIASKDNVFVAMTQNMDSLLLEKNQDKMVVLFYNKLPTTRYFKEIWSLIHFIVENYIGTKDSKWLVKYLWETCKSQCSNQWNENCYFK